jgi:hypothetical protein
MYVYTRIFTLYVYIGAVVFGQVLERKVEWQNIEALLMETHKVLVRDILSDMTEELDFRDRVIGMAVGFGSLFVFLLIYRFFFCDMIEELDLRDRVIGMAVGFRVPYIHTYIYL